MNFYINTDVVLQELKSMNESFDELEQIVSNIESNISAGWDSDRAKTLVTPKIEEIRSSIKKMRESSNRVHLNVQQYATNVQSADAAGNITSTNN